MGLLVVHLLIFAVVLRSYPQWRPIWFLFTSVAEGVLLSKSLSALFGSNVR